MKGISLTVYYNPQYRGCANGGISTKFDELLIACDRGNLDIKGDEENLVKLVHRVIGDRDVYHLEPVNNSGGGWLSFGGSYADTDDSRFKEMHGVHGALAIHDRKEW